METGRCFDGYRKLGVWRRLDPYYTELLQVRMREYILKNKWHMPCQAYNRTSPLHTWLSQSTCLAPDFPSFHHSLHPARRPLEHTSCNYPANQLVFTQKDDGHVTTVMKRISGDH